MLFQSLFTASFLHSAIFLKKSNFSFQKTHHVFPSEKLKFELFKKFQFLNAIVVQLSYFQRFLKKSKSFFEKPIYVFSNKKLKFGTFWSIFLIQLQSASNWLLLAVSKKTQDIFWATNFFSRRNQFLNVLRSLTNSVASYNKFLSLAISKKYFFSKNPYIFFIKTKFWRLREVLLFQSLFTASFLHSAIFLKKSNFSFQKTHHVFPSEKLKFELFKKFQFLNAIVGQICYF